MSEATFVFVSNRGIRRLSNNWGAGREVGWLKCAKNSSNGNSHGRPVDYSFVAQCFTHFGLRLQA